MRSIGRSFGLMASILIAALAVVHPAAGAEVRTVTSATAQDAVNSAKPGDILVAADGTYAGILVRKVPGTAAAPITFKAEHNQKVIIQGPGDGFRLQDSPHWFVSGIRCEKCAIGIAVMNSEGVVLSHVATDHCTQQGLLTGMSAGFTIDGADFGFTVATHTFNGHGAYVSNGSTHPTVRHVYAHDCDVCGIQINGEGNKQPIEGAIVAGCRVERCGKVNRGAALNLLVLSGAKVKDIAIRDCLAGGIACFKATGVVIDGGSVAFAPGTGRACISSKAGSSVTYGGLSLTAGKAPPLEVDANSTLSASPTSAVKVPK